MKEQLNNPITRTLPALANESGEAEWCYQNRGVHGKQLLDAVQTGEAQILTRDKLVARVAASKKSPANVVAL
jgi:hypothetical protein